MIYETLELVESFVSDCKNRYLFTCNMLSFVLGEVCQNKGTNFQHNSLVDVIFQVNKCEWEIICKKSYLISIICALTLITDMGHECIKTIRTSSIIFFHVKIRIFLFSCENVYLTAKSSPVFVLSTSLI